MRRGALAALLLVGTWREASPAPGDGYRPMPLLSKGHPVDWWFVFKLDAKAFPGCGAGQTPQCPFGGSPVSYKTPEGLQFAVASSESPTLQAGSGCAGNGLKDPIGATFDQIYHGSSNYVIWNDQMYGDPAIPGCSGGGCSSPWGHSKGVLTWNEAGEGMVMQVTTPSWPASGSSSHERQTDGNSLGCVKDNNMGASQHFFSVKLNKSDVVAVLRALSNASVATDPNNPQIVKNGGPAEIQQLVQGLGRLSNDQSYTDQTLSTGVRLISKPARLEAPPWPLVSAILGGVPLRTATWFAPPKTPETLDYVSLDCWPKNLTRPGDVEEADSGKWQGKSFSLAGGPGSDANHAKLAVSTSGRKHLTVFGDLNEQGVLTGNCASSQNGRGGLFFVVDDGRLWSSVTGLLGGTAPGLGDGSWWGKVLAMGGEGLTRAKQYAEDNPAKSWAIALTALALIVLPSRLILMLFAQDIFLINKVAPWFYLTGYGRWKLYRMYRAETAQRREVREDALRYVDLPYVDADGEANATLSKTILESLARKRGVALVSEGGRGKTTLCHALTAAMLRGDVRELRCVEPVLIDGLSYDGDLMDAIVRTLTQSRAYVNKTIVESQLAGGRLAVLFDGVSEVRESYRGAAEMTDIPGFVQQHPDTPFLFTSRSTLPAGITRSLREVKTLTLKELDAATEKILLAQYLKRGGEEVDAVVSQMDERLGALPRIPLMLKLVAAVYDETGQVPEDRSTLLSQYADKLLRQEVTGLRDPAGIRFALRFLVKETFLKSGGDRGFSIDQGVLLLGTLRDRLADFDVKLSPIELLRVLCEAGVLLRVADYCRFFHDSFESYFGARAMAAEFQQGEYATILTCKGNARVKESMEFLEQMLEPETQRTRLLAMLKD